MKRAITSRVALVARPPSAASEQVGGAAAEQEQTAVAEDVARHDPLQLSSGEVKVLLDGGQCHPDHRHVESVEEQDTAEDDERGPQRPAPPGRG
jgi:hypothetical protein